MNKVILITGTSSGLGRALAQMVLKLGARVVLTARTPESVSDLVQKYPGNALPLRLDVTNESDRNEVVDKILVKFGRIDVLVNNAGQGSLGAFEVWEKKSEAMAENLARWRYLGESTTFDNAEMTSIGG